MPSTYELWASARTAPAERVVAFEAWVYAELAARLVWPVDEALKARQIGQARSWVLGMVEDLNRHGFLFRPAELRDEIVNTLARVRARQDAGEVADLYPYLRACWSGYVRKEAERLRDTALSTGSHIRQIMARVTSGPSPARPAVSMVELLAEVRAARRAERAPKPRPAATTTPDLLTDHV